MKRDSSPTFVIAGICFYLILPLAMTFVYSVFREWMDVLPNGFTLTFYAELFADMIFWQSLARTVIISFVPVVLTAALLLLVMCVIVVYMPRIDKYVQILCTIPYAIQGIILPVSVLSLYAGAPWPFSNRILILTLTYCIVILPYMYQGIKNSLISIDARRILEAAEMLGASKFYAFFHIITPCAMSGVIISSMLSVAMIFGDFVIVNTIGGNYFYTSQMYLLKKMFISGQLTSAVIVVLFTVTLIISAAAFYLKSKTRINEVKEED